MKNITFLESPFGCGAEKVLSDLVYCIKDIYIRCVFFRTDEFRYVLSKVS